MNQRMIVAWMFRVGAVLVGLPALIGLVDITANLFLISRVAHHIQPGQPLDIQKYGIVGIVTDGGQLLGAMLELLAGLGMVAAVILAFMFVVVIVFAILFFFTGNGVARRADWARVMGIVLSAIGLLFWLVGLNADSHGAVAVACVGVAASAYAIWALGWRYV